MLCHKIKSITKTYHLDPRLRYPYRIRGRQAGKKQLNKARSSNWGLCKLENEAADPCTKPNGTKSLGV